MKETIPTNVKLASVGGKYFRLVLDPLTNENNGMRAILFLKTEKPGVTAEVFGTIISVRPTDIWVAPEDPEKTLVINPEIVAGWTTPRLFLEDVLDTDLQNHPEKRCPNFQKKWH